MLGSDSMGEKKNIGCTQIYIWSMTWMPNFCYPKWSLPTCSSPHPSLLSVSQLQISQNNWFRTGVSKLDQPGGQICLRPIFIWTFSPFYIFKGLFKKKSKTQIGNVLYLIGTWCGLQNLKHFLLTFYRESLPVSHL